MAREGDVLLEQDVIDNEEVINKLNDINKSLEELLTLEADKNDEVVNELKKINEFLVEQKEQEEKLYEEEEYEQVDVYEEILVSINENLELSNSYMYTINVYMAGFFVIVILYLIIKALIGFFKPFL